VQPSSKKYTTPVPWAARVDADTRRLDLPLLMVSVIVDRELCQHERHGCLCPAALHVNPGEHGTQQPRPL